MSKPQTDNRDPAIVEDLAEKYEYSAKNLESYIPGTKAGQSSVTGTDKNVSNIEKSSIEISDEVLGAVPSHHEEQEHYDQINVKRVESVPSQAATATAVDDDPMELVQRKRSHLATKQLKKEYPNAKPRKVKKFYTRQNALIDQFLQSGDEERLAALDLEENGPKIKFAIYGSASVNFCLFIIQMYAAVSTGSLSLFATAADAFMDLVSSIVMMVTARMARRPSVYKYPIGRTRIETVGIILFCALMTTVAVQLLVESGRALGDGEKTDKPLQVVPLICVGVASGFLRLKLAYPPNLTYPACRVFYLDHRNDIVVNSFGLVMSIVGTHLVWWLDPLGAILIGLLILFSWASTAFEHVWLLVGKSAPREFISKVLYVSMTHDDRIRSIDTCRAYHAGEKYFVEIDIIMDESAPLKVTHDVSQTLQRKVEGLEDVERAFVHVDYNQEHDPFEEHKPLYGRARPKNTFKTAVLEIRKRFSRSGVENV